MYKNVDVIKNMLGLRLIIILVIIALLSIATAQEGAAMSFIANADKHLQKQMIRLLQELSMRNQINTFILL